MPNKKKSNEFIFSYFQKKALGHQLMEQVFYHLDIIEKDYFGLQFTDPYNVPHWLDPTKLVKKQVKSMKNQSYHVVLNHPQWSQNLYEF